MVSVTAVKIQLSSPRMVCKQTQSFSEESDPIAPTFLLLSCPGIWSIKLGSILSREDDLLQNHRRAIVMGVVKHEVKTSAGSSGFCGRSWFQENSRKTGRKTTKRGE